ncbi:hypothetical protein, partial [Streptobacillus felis]|uniref:hypothetical protein n=1 Tax=Streptobacillus felis TaxID=1384509 RepID=UPI000B0197AE
GINTVPAPILESNISDNPLVDATCNSLIFSNQLSLNILDDSSQFKKSLSFNTSALIAIWTVHAFVVKTSLEVLTISTP